MVFSALRCGCLQGLALQRGKPRAKHDLIEDEAARYHDEDAQAKIKAFHEAKQQQENGAKALQEVDNAAKKRAAADSGKMNHADLVGRLEQANVEMEATVQPEGAKKAVPQITKEGTSPQDVQRPDLENPNSLLDGTRIESRCAVEMEAEKQQNATKEPAPQLKKEGSSPEGVRRLPLEDSNLSWGSTRIESPCAIEMEADEQPEAAEEPAPQLKKEGTPPEHVRCPPLGDSNVSLESMQIESPCDAEMEVQEQPEAAKEVASQLGTSPEDAQFYRIWTPRESANATEMEAKEIQGFMERVMEELAATGHGVPDSMKPVAEGQRTQVVLQGMADDGVQMIPQPHEKSLAFESATEAASLKQSLAKSSAPENQLNRSTLNKRRNRAAAVATEGGAALARTAVLASCAVVVIAVLAFHVTSCSP